MRKLIVLLLAFVLAMGICGCGSEPESKVPDFESSNISAISASEAFASGQLYDYVTICEADGSKATKGTVKVADYSETEAPEGYDTSKNCRWVTLKLELAFGDEAANESGYRYSYKIADYYNIKDVQDTMFFDVEKSCEVFKVKTGGKKYSCKGLVNKSSDDWAMNDETGLQSCREYITWTFMLPEGYDGLCCGIYNSSKEDIVSAAPYVNQCTEDPGFIFFRLD